MRTSLTNHANAFTVFKDRTASCGKKVFTGKIEVGGAEYEYYSINDTILRQGQRLAGGQPLHRTLQEDTPPRNPSLTNPLLKKALYVVAKNTSGNPMTVNDGWFEATVTRIDDGRTTPLAEAPYLTTLDEWAVQLTGATAEAFAAKLSVGSTLRIRADVAVDGVTKPIVTQNSTMYHLLADGVDQEPLLVGLRPDDLCGCGPGRNESPLLRHRRPSGLGFDGREVLRNGPHRPEIRLLERNPFRRRRLDDPVALHRRCGQGGQQALRLERRTQLHELYACADQTVTLKPREQ